MCNKSNRTVRTLAAVLVVAHHGAQDVRGGQAHGKESADRLGVVEGASLIHRQQDQSDAGSTVGCHGQTRRDEVPAECPTITARVSHRSPVIESFPGSPL